MRDWTQIPDAKVPPEEAAVILKEIETDGLEITLEIFRQGLEVELEHGTRLSERECHKQSSGPDRRDCPRTFERDFGLL